MLSSVRSIKYGQVTRGGACMQSGPGFRIGFVAYVRTMTTTSDQRPSSPRMRVRGDPLTVRIHSPQRPCASFSTRSHTTSAQPCLIIADERGIGGRAAPPRHFLLPPMGVSMPADALSKDGRVIALEQGEEACHEWVRGAGCRRHVF